MVGFTTYLAGKVLGHVTGFSAYAEPSPYLGLFTAVGTNAGSGFTEVSGGSYARQVASGNAIWAAPYGGPPTFPTSLISNLNAITFPTSTAAWGTVLAVGFFDALTAGNLLAWDFLGNNPWFPFSCTSASPGVLTAIGITAGSSPTFANGSLAVVTNEFGGTLPAGLTQYTEYTVAGLSADTFNLGTNTTSTGSGAVREVITQVVPNNTQVTLNTGALTLSLN